MSKYINADEYQNYLAITRLNHPKSIKLDFNDGIMYAIEAVKSFPSANVIEVKHGKWIVDKEPTLYDNIYYGMYKQFCCSVCNSQFKEGYNFCPNCGADMRGEANE